MFTNLNVTGLKLEVARDTDRHVKKTLPPSFSSFPGVAEIRYFVKATIIRPQFYKENIRAVRTSMNTMHKSHALPGVAKRQSGFSYTDDLPYMAPFSVA